MNNELTGWLIMYNRPLHARVTAIGTRIHPVAKMIKVAIKVARPWLRLMNDLI